MKKKTNAASNIRTAITIVAATLILSQACLIISKLIGYITLSWWLVFLPSLIAAGLVLIVYAVITTLVLIASSNIEEETNHGD